MRALLTNYSRADLLLEINRSRRREESTSTLLRLVGITDYIESSLLSIKDYFCTLTLHRAELPGMGARSVVGCRREDHITIVDLLEAAKYLSLNQQAVKATAMSTWTAYHSCDGTSGTRNPVGEAMFSGAELPTARVSRSATAGEVRVRTRGLDTHVTHGLEAWNACRELRDSRTKAEACRAATRLSRESPL
jgi:hypothetical protein